MEGLKPPSEMQWEGNVAENWRKWYQVLTIYYTASGIATKTDAVKIAALLHIGGEQLISVYNAMKWDEDGDVEGDDKKYEKVVAKFQKYCEPRKNLTYLRYQFFTRAQSESETVENLVTDLRNKARDCEFGALEESLIKDRLICGIRDDNVRKRLLRDPNLTLTRAVDICRASAVTEQQAQQLMPNMTSSAASVNAIGQAPVYNCNKCGNKHRPRQCPAYGKRCHKCRKLNHYASKCPETVITAEASRANSSNSASGQSPSQNTQGQGGARRKQRNQRRRYGRNRHQNQQVHGLRENEESEDEEPEFYIGMVKESDKSEDEDPWSLTLNINNRPIDCRIDSGSDADAMPMMIYHKLGGSKKDLKKSKKRLKSYSNHKLNVKGQVTLACEYKDGIHPITFDVVDVKSTQVMLSAKTCEHELKVIKRVNAVGHDEYVKINNNDNNDTVHVKQDFMQECQQRKLFSGIGCMEGEVKLQVKENAIPKVHPPRKYPISQRQALQNELKRMEDQGIIVKQIEPTEWVNSLVTPIKGNGSLRVCMDPKDLNAALRREHYPMNTIENVVTHLKDAQYFTVLDANAGYWQLKLDYESSQLCTFNTPFGRYRFLRMPFGLNVAPEIFQRRMTQLFERVEGVQVVMDDILIYGATEQQHYERVIQVLDILEKAHVTLNKDKCKFKQHEVKYLGHVLTKDGLKCDPEKVRAILEMPEPHNVESLRRFLGMLNYIGKFVDKLSESAEPLRGLLVKGVSWEWTETHSKCFDNLKNMLCQAPILAFYDETKELVLSVDASSKGLGATLLQGERPIAYASRALTSAECNYSQIEELLAISWGCKKFYDYVAFRKVVVESDHKPLESIMKKPLYSAPLRLQNMLMSMRQFDLEVKYKKGKELYIADTLSRAFVQEVNTIQVETLLDVNLVKEQAPISEAKFGVFRTETEKDPELSVVSQVVKDGWPENIRNCPTSAKPYFTVRDELSLVDGVLFKSNKIVVPKSLRAEMLTKIHESHQGIVRCKQRARECLYWPGMMTEIYNLITQCSKCKLNANYQQRQPLVNHEIPDQPWVKVGSDLFEHDGAQYCLVVDYYSKFPEIVRLGNQSTSHAVIIALKSIFSRHGIPRLLVTDNGPCYSSREFRQFVKDWEFEHVTSSPKYPRSNGMAERYVGTVKSLLKKATDPYLSMLEFRTTPIDDLGLSPAQLLMGRRLNTKIPIHKELLKPQPVNSEDVKQHLNQKQAVQKFYYDRGTKNLSSLNIGDGVRVWEPERKQWKPAIVETVCDKPRSYIVVTEQGSKLRRNRQDILKSEDVTFIPESQTEQFHTYDQYDTMVKPNLHVTTAQSHREQVHVQDDPTPLVSVGLRRSGRQTKIPKKYQDYDMT